MAPTSQAVKKPTKTTPATASAKVKANSEDDDDDEGEDVPKKEIKKPIRPASFTISTPQTKERYLKLLVYGGYGVGKTFLSGTSVDVRKMNDILLIDAESGDLTLEDVGDKTDFDFGKIDSIRITDYKQLARVHEFLKIHCMLRDKGDKESIQKLITKESELKGMKVKKPRLYRTVIIDSLTEVETYCMYQLLGIEETTKLDEEVATPEWTEYKRNHSMVQRMVRSFRDLPMHIIMTCAQQYTQDDQKRMLYTPALTGKLASQIQGFMDMVGYLQVGSPRDDGTIPRRLHVQPTGKFAAKCRFSSFKGSHFDDPTIESILEAIDLQPGKIR